MLVAIISPHDWCPPVLHIAALKTYYEGYGRHVALRLSLVQSIKFSLQLLTTLLESVLMMTTTALFPFLIKKFDADQLHSLAHHPFLMLKVDRAPEPCTQQPDIGFIAEQAFFFLLCFYFCFCFCFCFCFFSF